MSFPVQALVQPAFQNILFATDFSFCSEEALPYARAIAQHYGSTVHLVHVVGSEPVMGPLGVPYPDLEGDIVAARERMRKLVQTAAFKSLPHTENVQRGGIPDVVSKLVDDLRIELIVLGTHGRRGPVYFALGSVAELILRRSRCPVLTVRPEVRNRGLAQGKPAAIVYATDFSPASLHAREYALALARSYRAKLVLLHVLHSSEIAFDRFDDAVARTKARLWELMPEAPDIRCEVVATSGAAPEMILEVAQQAQADLVVMGAHRGAAVSAHMPCAIAHQVVCHAFCPVLTVSWPKTVATTSAEAA